ncbi:MAG: hypothetical protein QG622_1264, partial [Actinomycetota bacterium]|nr:hypothetical protein [Actinomycetota bacterium]
MLITFPSSWPDTTVAALAMTTLALLDLGGAYAAKEAVLRRSLPFAAAGVVLFILLFWVYASSLRYAELASVTLGWVVLLQVGVVLLDRLHYGTPVSRGQWAAVVVVLAAQAYLVMAPSAAGSPDAPAHDGRPPAPAPAVPAVPAARVAPGRIAPGPVVPGQFAPVKATSVKATPVKAAPSKAAPSKAAPAKAARSKGAVRV